MKRAQAAFLHALVGALFVLPIVGVGNNSGIAVACAVFTIIFVLIIMEWHGRRLDNREMALLAGIAAIDSALRLAIVTGIGGFSPVFFLIICAGYVFGSTYGFLCGSIVLLTSGLVTGGIGAWLPYEMLAAGWVGAIAGVAGRTKRAHIGSRDIFTLVIVAVITGFLYGALTDTWDWATFYRSTPTIGWTSGLSATDAATRFVRFYITTSLIWDAFRAAGTAAMVVLLGKPVLLALTRVHRKTAVLWEEHEPSPSSVIRYPATQ